MDKKKLIEIFTRQISDDLSTLTQAAIAAHDAATHSESKAEDQYDTRGLEASYLASSQSKRAMELEETLAIYRHVDIRSFSDTTPIASTAVIELETDRKRNYYLLMPKGGGMHASFEGKTIQVITPQSPIGEAVLGKKTGDQIEVIVGKTPRDFEIVAVW